MLTLTGTLPPRRDTVSHQPMGQCYSRAYNLYKTYLTLRLIQSLLFLGTVQLQNNYDDGNYFSLDWPSLAVPPFFYL